MKKRQLSFNWETKENKILHLIIESLQEKGIKKQ